MKQLLQQFERALEALNPLLDLFLRYWMFNAFFFAGLGKWQSWSSTVFLFTHEYQVPLLSPSVAAMLATAAELVLPVLVLIGLGSRLPSFLLFLVNAMAVWSYPFLHTAAGAEGLEDHFYWALILAVLMCKGVGSWSVDRALAYYLSRNNS